MNCIPDRHVQKVERVDILTHFTDAMEGGGWIYLHILISNGGRRVDLDHTNAVLQRALVVLKKERTM